MEILEDVLVDDLGIDLNGWTLGNVNGISGDGLVIVGTGTNPSDEQQGWIVFLPEPAVPVMLLSGIVVLALLARVRGETLRADSVSPPPPRSRSARSPASAPGRAGVAAPASP